MWIKITETKPTPVIQLNALFRLIVVDQQKIPTISTDITHFKWKILNNTWNYDGKAVDSIRNTFVLSSIKINKKLAQQKHKWVQLRVEDQQKRFNEKRKPTRDLLMSSIVCHMHLDAKQKNRLTTFYEFKHFSLH